MKWGEPKTRFSRSINNEEEIVNQEPGDVNARGVIGYLQRSIIWEI